MLLQFPEKCPRLTPISGENFTCEQVLSRVQQSCCYRIETYEEAARRNSKLGDYINIRDSTIAHLSHIS